MAFSVAHAFSNYSLLCNFSLFSLCAHFPRKPWHEVIYRKHSELPNGSSENSEGRAHTWLNQRFLRRSKNRGKWRWSPFNMLISKTKASSLHPLDYAHTFAPMLNLQKLFLNAFFYHLSNFSIDFSLKIEYAKFKPIDCVNFWSLILAPIHRHLRIIMFYTPLCKFYRRAILKLKGFVILI